MSAESPMDQLVKEHQAEKKIALVCADLFDHIAKSERQRADTMRSERACRAFRVDIRSASYFRCRCGHPKSAHAFSPLPEEQHFVSSAGITPKWTVNEDGDGDGDDNSSLGAMSSLSRDESRSLGAGLDGVDGNGEPIQMVALPCLDEFRQQFAARSQTLLQPMAAPAPAVGSGSATPATDRDASSERQPTLRLWNTVGNNGGSPGASGGGGLFGGGDHHRSPVAGEGGARVIESNGADIGSGGVRGGGSGGGDDGHFDTQQQRQRMREEVWEQVRRELLQEVREEIRQEVSSDVNNELQRLTEEHEQSCHEALLQAEVAQKAVVESVEENCRVELEGLQSEFLAQLDAIEANAKTHISEVRQQHEEQDTRRERRRKALAVNLQRQVDAQREELAKLRAFRDQILRTPTATATSAASPSSSSSLAAPSSSLGRPLMQVSEGTNESSEEDDNGGGASLVGGAAVAAVAAAAAAVNAGVTAGVNSVEGKIYTTDNQPQLLASLSSNPSTPSSLPRVSTTEPTVTTEPVTAVVTPSPLSAVSKTTALETMTMAKTNTTAPLSLTTLAVVLALVAVLVGSLGGAAWANGWCEEVGDDAVKRSDSSPEASSSSMNAVSECTRRLMRPWIRAAAESLLKWHGELPSQ